MFSVVPVHDNDIDQSKNESCLQKLSQTHTPFGNNDPDKTQTKVQFIKNFRLSKAEKFKKFDILKRDKIDFAGNFLIPNSIKS